MSSRNFFADTPPIKLFFIAVIPGIISMLASSLYGLIDGVFVGRILGDTPFAALNLAFPFVVINFSLADLIGVGSSVPISISLGKGEDDKANNYFTCACLMILVTGILMGIILFAAAPLLIGLMGAEGELAVFAVRYLRVYAICSPITTIVFAMDNYLRICGRVRTSMALNIAMAVISAVLEFILLGVLGWDIRGAAIATCAGMCVCAIAAFSLFVRGNMQLKLCRPKFSMSMIRQVVACGCPNFLNNIAGRLTSIIMNVVLLRMGGESAVSIYGILMYVNEFVQPILYGICDSLQPAVGYNWGAADYRRVSAIEKCCFTAAAVVSLISSAVIFLIPEELASLFVAGSSSELISAAGQALTLFSLTYVTRWFSFAAQSYMLAVDRPVSASVISFSTAFIFPVVLIAVLYPLGLTGLWLNFAVTSLLAAVLAGGVLVVFAKDLRKRKIIA